MFAKKCESKFLLFSHCDSGTLWYFHDFTLILKIFREIKVQIVFYIR